MRAWLVIFVCLMVTPAGAQEIFCVDDDAELEAQMSKHNEILVFIGENKTGQIFFVFAGKSSWTVWFLKAQGIICTGPQYLGDILKRGKET